MRARITLAVATAVAVQSYAARAADHTNLEEGLPVEAADAYAVNHHSRESQALARYEYSRDRTSKVMIDPRFEWGVVRNGQLAVRVPVMLETGKRVDLGRVAADALYNFNQETLTVPAFAIGGMVEAPTGAEAIDKSFDPAMKLNVTKHLPGTTFLHALHFNAMWQFNVRRHAEEERAGRYKLIGAYSFRVSSWVLGIADFVREQRMEFGRYSNVAELGFRMQLTPLLVAAVGGGVGIGADSPRFRAALAIQYRPF